MQVKCLEVRDRATFIPVMAVSTVPDNEGQGYLLRRVGFRDLQVIMTWLTGERQATADPYFWNDRTLQVAHSHILEHWEDLSDGDVVDVEFILGETTTKKISERVSVCE